MQRKDADRRSRMAGPRKALRLRWLAPALCLICTACALWLGAALPSKTTSESTLAQQTGSSAVRGDRAPGEESEDSEWDSRGDEGTVPVEEGVIDTGSFLAELDRDASTQADGEASCVWTSAQPINELAADVLRVYQGVSGAQLMTSGYLDLKGNAWGAIVLDECGWVDIVTVVAEEGNEASTARVTRISSSARSSE